MKNIEAVIRHHKVDAVKSALHELGIAGLTVTEARGFGRQKGHTETYRGVEYAVDLLPKAKLQVVVSDRMAAKVVETIANASRTGEIGDGKIFVSEMIECVRIRTGETGEGAV